LEGLEKGTTQKKQKPVGLKIFTQGSAHHGLEKSYRTESCKRLQRISLWPCFRCFVSVPGAFNEVASGQLIHIDFKRRFLPIILLLLTLVPGLTLLYVWSALPISPIHFYGSCLGFL